MMFPLRDNLVVMPVETVAETEFGFVIAPSTNKEKPIEGEIIHVGPDCVVEVGDIVIFEKYGAVSFPKVFGRGSPLLMMSEKDVFAVTRKPNKKGDNIA